MVTLITFSLSHYCEKVRWALDWHGIAFDEVGWPSGLHMTLARRLGAPRSSLPILKARDELVQAATRSSPGRSDTAGAAGRALPRVVTRQRRARSNAEAELDWLDGRLSDGRPFLEGDHFSRVDLTVAALLAPFARPPQAEPYSQMRLPPALERDVERWRGRRAIKWVNRLYGDYRRTRGSEAKDE